MVNKYPHRSVSRNTHAFFTTFLKMPFTGYSMTKVHRMKMQFAQNLSKLGADRC